MALPVIKVVPPSVLEDQENGRLDADILVSTPGLAGGPTVRLVEPAARAWRALADAAREAGHTLKATSAGDSYRTYERQVATFIARYEPDDFPGSIGQRWWPAHYDERGNWVKAHLWFQKPNTAVAAAPGYSNHGLGIAVDTGEERDGDAGTESIDARTLNWLTAHAGAFGWSWEVQSEPWHIRYCTGDAIPPAVLAFEEDQAMPTAEEIAAAVARYVYQDAARGFPNINQFREAEISQGTNAQVFELTKELTALRGQVDQILDLLNSDTSAPGGGATREEVESIVREVVAAGYTGGADAVRAD